MSPNINFADPRYTDEDLRRMRNEITTELKARIERAVTPALRRRLGNRLYAVKIRDCKGCGKPFTATEMRTHTCDIAWPYR